MIDICGDLMRHFASLAEGQRKFDAWLSQADEPAMQNWAEHVQLNVSGKERLELHSTLSHLLLRLLEPGDKTIVNGHSYRVAAVEGDRPEHQVTDASVELIRDERVVAIDTGLHGHGYRVGPLWDTTEIPQDKAHWDGERGNRAERRGTNPGIEVGEASAEDLDAFRTEIIDVVVGLLRCGKTRLLKLKLESPIV